MKSVTSPALALTVVALFSVALLASCARKSVQAPPQPAAPPPASHTEVTPPPPAHAPAPAPAPAVQASDFRDIYFEYDRYNLDDRDRAALDADAKLLRDQPDVKIMVEGHCDERGTVEYNLSLGERRANAARDYLTAAGVMPTQVQTISYGKERPFCSESNEACWAKNRCGHFVLR